MIAYRLHERALGQGRTALPIENAWTPHGLTLTEAELDRLLAAPLVWLSGGTATAVARTGLPLNDTCNYLLARDEAGRRLVQAWPRRPPP